jgi:CHAT domain-containing protein
MTATAMREVRRASGVRLAEAMARVPDEPARQRLFVRWPRLAKPRVAQRLLDAAREHLRIDGRLSLILAKSAATVATRLDDRRLLGQSHRAAANALCVSGNIREALDLHNQARADFEQVGDKRELARTFNASIQPLILLGQYDRALCAAARARALFTNDGDDLHLARLDINVGNLLHRQDRFDEALACYETAHAWLLSLGDIDGVISALHNKAVTLTALNEFHQALSAYQTARRLCVEHHMPLAVAQNDYNIAWLHYLRGEYGRAIELLRQTAAFAKQQGDGYHAALSLLDLSEIYLELNLNDDAQAMAVEARSRFLQLGMGYEAAKALVNVAIARGRDGELARAVELFAEARERLVQENNHVWPSLIDLYRAILLFDEGRVLEARRLCLAALAFFSGTTLRTKTALCRLLLARICLTRGEPENARSECARALDDLKDDDTPSLTYHAQLILGNAEAALGDPRRAYASYQVAREAVETLRGRLPAEELKIAFVKNKQEVYERLVELCLNGGRGPGADEEIFSYVEQAKSRALLNLMFQSVHALPRPHEGESELTRSIRDLRKELSWFHHKIELEELGARHSSSQHLEHLQRELAARERDFARVVRELTLSGARDAELHEPRVHAIDAIRASLPEDAVLLEYFDMRDRIIACLLDRQGLTIAPVSATSRISTHVRMLQFQLSKFRLGADYVDTFGDLSLQSTQHHLRALFTELLEPVWPAIGGRHLLVVPHGSLHDVPFGALLDGDRYVIDECSVSYAPSASTYAQCHARQGSTVTDALVLGISDARAPFIETEAQAVAAILPGARLFVGADATEDVLRTYGAASRIVHISMHGRFRRGNPMFSGIRLGDTYLNVYDLYHLNLPAELVTLSGCATGANVATAGDELLGITRGLFCAGAQASLVSLWDVHDQSSARFMELMYGRIVASTPPARAVREAMVDLRRDYPHPFHWAPFVLSGKFWHP